MGGYELIPEVHDIGKLVDKNWIKCFISQKLGIVPKKIDWDHNFLCTNKDTGEELEYLQFFGLRFNETPTYRIIRYHHDLPPKSTKALISEFADKKKDYTVFLACVADYMASSVSRTLTIEELEKIKMAFENKTLLKLWKPDVEKIKLFSSENDFKHLVEFTNSIQDKTQYIEEFYEKMLRRPEEFRPPQNITSLFIHTKLVGKLYRFFEANTKEISTGVLSFGERSGNSPDHARENWHIKIVKGRIRFSHYPARIKDLNIFEILNNEIYNFSQLDNVILSTSTQFLAVLPPNASVTELVKPFVERGFFVFVEEATTKLKNAYLTPQSVKELESQNLEKNLKKQREMIEKIPDKNKKDIKLKELDKDKKLLEFEELFPVCNVYDSLHITINKLCEVCQMQPATEDWPDEESGITEHLCKNCYSIRAHRKEPPAPKIDLWYKEEPHSKIAWIKINLDIESLAKVLEELLKKYIQKIENNATKDIVLSLDDIKLRFSVLAEFQQDFDLFLKDFNNQINEYFKNENVQPILDDFLCIKLDKTSKIKNILEIYYNIFTDYFPELKKQKPPITLSISVSNVKFAFFRHWRILDNPADDVNVVLIGSGEMHLTLNQLEDLIELRMPASKQLHKLAKISETSEKLAKVLVYDKGDFRVYNDLQAIRDAKDKKIDFKTILTFAKIMKEEHEVL